MGMSPSEKTKLLKDVRAMRDDIESVNANQDKELGILRDDMKAVLLRMNAMQKQINDLLMAQKMREEGVGECKCDEPKTKKASKK